MPFLPQRIGIITSATGAAIRDILKVIDRRFPNREILLIPTSVQGDKAAGEIVAAIQRAERWNATNTKRLLDVLIVGRGGGSVEDLWPFNEEVVARAISRCAIPILSAVGHEIDFTIADFVADQRAATPSAAAEIVLPPHEDLHANIEQLTERLASPIFAQVEQMQLHVQHLSERLIDPREKLSLQRQQVGQLITRLKGANHHLVERHQSRWRLATDKLHTLSPLGVLTRGYTITRRTNKNSILRSFKEAEIGEEIQTCLHDGVLHSKVLSRTANPS